MNAFVDFHCVYGRQVVRESNNGDASSVKPIEIPPPRPKRKPMHPYPRKLATPVKSGTLVPEKPTRSISPNMSMSEQKNQSPASVLSAHGSDALGTVDSSKRNGSASPVSPAGGGNSDGFVLSEPPNFILQDSSSLAQACVVRLPLLLLLFCFHDAARNFSCEITAYNSPV